jgi:hypothetical protein
VDPECDVVGLAIVVVAAEVGPEVAGPDPGFRRIEARLRRGAYHQPVVYHFARRGLTMEGAPKDLTPTLALLVRTGLTSVLPSLA